MLLQKTNLTKSGNENKIIVMKKVFLINCIVVLIFSCNSDKTIKIESIKTDAINSDSLINQAILTGDTLAYSKVSNYYILHVRGDEFLYNAMAMAHKYNYPEAYFHVYWILANP